MIWHDPLTSKDLLSSSKDHPWRRSIFETQQRSPAHGAGEASQDQSMAGKETMEEDWWEIVPESEAAEDESEPVNSSMQNPELMLSFMVKVCSDPEGAQAADANLFQMLSQCQGGDLESGELLQGVEALDKFLDIYEKLSLSFSMTIDKDLVAHIWNTPTPHGLLWHVQV